jgi:multiple sugar transport system permease protein
MPPLRALSRLITPARTPYVLLLPFLLLFAVFGLFPLLFSLYLAFHSWEPTSGLGAMEYVGLENFSFALQDEWFWKSLKNTLWLALVAGLPQHLVAVPLAVLIDGLFKRSRNAVVGLYFLPYITSTVAIAILFSSLYSTDYGLINATLMKALGPWMSSPVDWLNDPDTIKPAIAGLVFWRYVGFNTVLYLAALQTVPRDLYEAARMDGASRWQQFVHITLPGLKPMMLFGCTLSIIGGLQLFEEPFILTNGKGGSDQAGMTSAVYLFRAAFDFNDFGAASAMSWLLLAVVAVLTWLTHKAFGAGKPA